MTKQHTNRNLDGRDELFVHSTFLAAQQRLVRGVPDQGVLETVGPTGRALTSNEVGVDQTSDVCLDHRGAE